VGDHRERAGQEQRRAGALPDPRRDESPGRGGEPGRERSGAEDRETREHDPLVPVHVAHRPARQHQPRERERVAVDDPLEPGHAGRKVAADARQRDVHDRHVEEHEGVPDAHRDEHEARAFHAFQRLRAAESETGAASPVPVTPPRRRARNTFRAAHVAAAALLVALLAGCGDDRQDVLHPAGKPAREIDRLWWIMLTGALIGFAVIVVLLFLGWARRNRPNLPFGGGDRAATILIVALGVAVPLVVLSALFVFSDVVVIRATDAPAASQPTQVEVIGHDWFWEVRYPGTTAVTANEIHIPVGRAVAVAVRTADVIHSFWVPELNRKIDLVPGRVNRIVLEADRPGVFRGQCAEFCGIQHAHMGLKVFAQPPARYRAWLQREASDAPAPVSVEASRGAQEFVSEDCAGCHTIRGTDARGTVGPDLTHLASRTTLAAVTIPNTPQQLAEWIRDPQHVKPGNRMPTLDIPRDDVDALVAYLESLK
jgi:cytochrome c oxidase subunit 2